jgi:hypothetical protein
MRSRNKGKPALPQAPAPASSRGLNFMLLSPGEGVRRFRLTRRHAVIAASVWFMALAVSFYLGFQGAAADDGAAPKLESAAPAKTPS